MPEGVPAEEKRENTERGPTKVYIDVREAPPRGVVGARVGVRVWEGRNIAMHVGSGLG